MTLPTEKQQRHMIISYNQFKSFLEQMFISNVSLNQNQSSSVMSCLINKHLMCNNEANRAFEPRREKTNVLVTNLVRRKLGCTATEDG